MRSPCRRQSLSHTEGTIEPPGWLCVEYMVHVGCVSMVHELHEFSAADQPNVDCGTQWHPLSAAVNNPMVCGAREGTLTTACSGSALTTYNSQLASPSTVRWSSAVDSTIELACTGLAHKARGPEQPSASLASVGCGMAAGAAFAHPRAADTRVRPIFFNHICHGYVPYTHATSHAHLCGRPLAPSSPPIRPDRTLLLAPPSRRGATTNK